jgi:hypothetical protein
MASAKSGTAGSIVAPTDPEVAVEADVADPGESTQIQSSQQQSQSGSGGSTVAPAHRPAQQQSSSSEEAADSEEPTEAKTSWIEIELIGEDDQPIPGEPYRITLPDGTVADGTLDEKGQARVEGFASGNCTLTFPNLDKDAWEKA